MLEETVIYTPGGVTATLTERLEVSIVLFLVLGVLGVLLFMGLSCPDMNSESGQSYDRQNFTIQTSGRQEYRFGDKSRLGCMGRVRTQN